MTEEAAPIPISLVAHTVFCPRRAWLEASGETVSSYNIEEGQRRHRPVDNPVAQSVRSIALGLSDPAWGLVGKADVLKETSSGIRLIEYKATPGKRTPTVSNANRVQLALQRHCLEQMGQTVIGQSVYFVNHKTEVQVELDDGDLDVARQYVEATRTLIASSIPPPPLLDDPRCTGCSHVGVCLPDERSRSNVKRVLPLDPDGEVLHLTTPGSRAGLSKGRIVVTRFRETIGSIPMERVVGLVVHGNVDISSALLRELMWRGTSIVWCSGRGKVVGFSRSARSPNGHARAAQHLDEPASILLARELLRPKVGNQATLLRRNSSSDSSQLVAQLRSLDETMAASNGIRELLSLEGRAAAVYFEGFLGMIRGPEKSFFEQSWAGRVGRGARDPLNVALNYAYGLLTSEAIRALLAAGLDPHIGFIHSSGRNKPALALDLIEQFRPIIADSTVILAINNAALSSRSFNIQSTGGNLSESGRKALSAAFEQRMGHKIRHPVFGYQVSWRRALEVQSRLLLAVYEGEPEAYKGIRTR